MIGRIGAVMLVAGLMFGGSAAMSSAIASALQATARQPHAVKAADFSTRRHARHHYRYAYRDFYLTYYERPYYYAPAPYVPFNYGYFVGPWAWW